MILRRLSTNLRVRNWTAIMVEFDALRDYSSELARKIDGL